MEILGLIVGNVVMKRFILGGYVNRFTHGNGGDSYLNCKLVI